MYLDFFCEGKVIRNIFHYNLKQSASVINSIDLFHGSHKLSCFLTFLSRARPEKLCDFYWLQQTKATA